MLARTRDRLLDALKQAFFRCAPRAWVNAFLRRRLPRTAILEATSACNLDCPLCPTHWLPRHGRYLAAEIVADVLDACAGSLRSVCFHIQGEPTLHPELFDFVRRCSAAGIESWFGTNGMLLDRHLDELFRSGLGVISIDIDGADAADYVKYRRRGDFERVVANVKALVAEKRRRGSTKPLIRVQTIMFTYNEEREAEVAALHASLGADRCIRKRPSYFHDVEVGKRQGLVIEPRVQRRADAAAADFLRLVEPDRTGSKYSRPRSIDERLLLRNRAICPQLEKLNVLCDGRVVACCMDGFGMTTFGDLRRERFRDVWRGARHRELIERFQRRSLGLCETCTLSTLD